MPKEWTLPGEYTADDLAKAAVAARKNAYIPYSRFAVGAALLAQNGTLYTGCNVENAAYSVCNCAERTALFKAVSEGVRHFAAIAVAGAPEANDGSGALPLCTPCGVCRQALYEFGGDTLPVILSKGTDGYEIRTLGELLPMGFGPQNLAE